VSNAASGKGRKAEMTDSKPSSDSEERQDEKWYDRTRYQILLFMGGIALFGLVLGLILDWYIDPQTSTQKKDLVQALGLITAGVAGAVGIFFTWRGQRLAREAQEDNQKNTLTQLNNAQEELRITRQGQMTERFTQAIEQLGSENLEIRLGGIYSLERTAQEDENYHWLVMEVLTSYVRRHAARKPEKEPREAATPAFDIIAWMENVATPEPDIQAILDVIGRRSQKHRTDKKVEYGTIDLSNTDLRGAYLQGAYLQGAYLHRAYLLAANLGWANLGGAYLGADAYLYRALLLAANLREANLQDAKLEGANLQDADLRSVNLYKAWLYDANLQGANLERATLEKALLGRAILREVNLEGAMLQGADLEGVSGITEDQLEWTVGSNETKLGEDLNRPDLWNKDPHEQFEITQEHLRSG
jgi:uncharacterized protein YjbI with pentapeptide repeats